MEIGKYIKSLEKKLDIEKSRLKKIETAHYSNQSIIEAKQNIELINDELNQTICSILEIESQDFRKIAIENYSYLSTDRIVFKTYKKDMSISGSYAETMKGKLHKNGHIYCFTESTNFPGNPFAKYMFPSTIEGKIDCIGNVSLKTTKTDWAIFDRVPSQMEGIIGDLGSIKIRTTEKENDFFSNGMHVVSRIISSYFFKTKEHEINFHMNRKILLDFINEYRKNQQNANN
jgi:hypothetical protein